MVEVKGDYKKTHHENFYQKIVVDGNTKKIMIQLDFHNFFMMNTPKSKMPSKLVRIY